MQAVVGIDAGGTRTRAALFGLNGELLGSAEAGAANYQSTGLDAALTELRAVADQVQRADCDIVARAIGLSGWDRPRDEEILRKGLNDAGLLGERCRLVNDTELILRAGTSDGVGIAVVSGTGSNCVGRNASGVAGRVGGLGFQMGDGGSAEEIGVDGLRAAFRGEDGRGPRTVLSARIQEACGFSRLDDVVDRLSADAERPLVLDQLAPLVTAAAVDGDEVAQSILRSAGVEMGTSVVVLAQKLELTEFVLVLGGSVLQSSDAEVMRSALVRHVEDAALVTTPVVLDVPPVTGAVLMASDLVDGGLNERSVGAALKEVLS